MAAPLGTAALARRASLLDMLRSTHRLDEEAAAQMASAMQVRSVKKGGVLTSIHAG